MSSETRQAVEAVCAGFPVFDSSGAWCEHEGRSLLKHLLTDGWHRVGLAERLGGHGGSVIDAADVASGLVPAASPLADVVMGSAHLLELADLTLPDDADVVVVATSASATLTAAGRLNARADRVPWAGWSSHLLVPVRQDDHTAVALVRTTEVTVTPGRNLAGEPRDRVDFDTECCAIARLPLTLEQVLAGCELRGALTRSVQMAAALQALVPLTAQHVRQRVQFGRPLAQFQAVQQQLAELAGVAAAAKAVTELALSHTAAGEEQAADLIACAKTRTSMAAGTGARIAHQLHGAIGTSQEHRLHRYTRGLWAWRDEHGSETVWARRIAEQLTGPDSVGLWPWLAGA